MANENLDIDSKTAEELYEWYLDDKLIINRRYQRKLVCSLEEKTALISSMTQQYPIPLLLFVSIDNKREILDGMQRLNSCSEYRYTFASPCLPPGNGLTVSIKWRTFFNSCHIARH